METKPNYVLVGAFTLIFISLFVGILLWLYGYKANEKYDTYLILTSQSVNGLSQGSPVKYKGVDVGSVEKIDIDPKNPNIVRIFVSIKHNIPIKEDTKAVISPQGLTGLSFIDLTGGSKNSPLLKDVDDRKYPVIKYQPSEIQQISQALPNILSEANTLIINMNKLFSKENRKNISLLLVNLNNNSKELNSDLKTLHTILKNSNNTILTIQNTTKNANNTIESFNVLAKSLKQDADNLSKLTANLNDLINKNKEGITNFTHQDIPKIEKLIHDIDITTHSANALINELNENPSYIIYGKPKTPSPTERRLK